MARLPRRAASRGGKPCRAAMAAHSSSSVVARSAAPAATMSPMLARIKHAGTGRNEHPLLPHLLHNGVADPHIELCAGETSGDGLDTIRVGAVARTKRQHVGVVEMQHAPVLIEG